MLISLGPGVGVAHEHGDRRAGRVAVEHSGEDLGRVRLLALGHEAALAGPAPVEVGLQV